MNFFIFFSIRLSSSHDLSVRFIRVAWGFLCHIFYFFYFVLQNSILFKIKLCFFFFCFALYWIILSVWSYSRIWHTHLVLLVLWILILFLLIFFLDFIILHFYLWGLMIIIFLSSLFMMLSHGFFSFFKIHDTFEHRFFTLQKNQLILQRSTDHLYINFFPVYLHK